ncbi:MAG: cytidylyltransferase domain-containing protein [Limnochordia bacterium]
MSALAVIPARGGSKGLPRKNVRLLCGKPLLAWTIEAATRAKSVERVVVSTDDAEIAEVSRRYGAQVVRRPKRISDDTSPSEEALLHALGQLKIDQGVLVFLQCTAPLMLPEDIDSTVAALEHADSAFTATSWYHFLWKMTAQGAVPVGHSKQERPMRQQKEPEFLEVGAVYAMKIPGFLQARHRFFGRVAMHLIPGERSIEIDDETDFLLAETLMRRRLDVNRAARLPDRVAALVMDFDGVLTDNRVGVDETGREAVLRHRGDGWAMQRLKEAGIRLLVLTNETNPCVKHCCAKLAVECIVAPGDKLPVLKEWLARHEIPAENTVYIGNDVPDVGCMLHVACGVAPADAYPSAKQAAQVVLLTPGGYGCIRELADPLLSRRP